MEDRDEPQTQLTWAEGGGWGLGRDWGEQMPPGQTREHLPVPFSGSRLKRPNQRPMWDPVDLTTSLTEGEGAYPSLGVTDSGLRRHLLDCAVRASMVGVKTPTPMSERAASWKWYSVSGFRSSRV